MSANRSASAFLSFLDYLGQKGLIPNATASSRKATANKVVSILSEEESQDVLSLDLDHLMQRFQNLNGQQYTPESLQTYKSRMKTALEDFRSYVENPLAFKPSGQGRTKLKQNGERPTTQKRDQGPNVHSPPPSPPTTSSTVMVLPIPLRSDLIVQIAGIPFDLTRGEAQKIANIILAHAAVD
jgi:hypothetical protein